MSNFNQCQAFTKLTQLAKDPFDLTKEGNLNSARIQSMTLRECGCELIYAMERVDDATIQALSELAKETNVIEKMQAMQAGKVINCIEGYPSENRAVLHTSLRDVFNKQNPSEIARSAANLAKKELEKLKSFLGILDKENRFNNLVVLAIGGSHLGPEALYLALRHLRKKDRHVFFINNIDPYDAAIVLKGLNLANTLVAVSSKSGTTLETVTNEELVRLQFEKAGLNSKDHFISITQQGSSIDDKSRYRECFYVQDFIGGRFSGSSLFGGLILSFAYGFETYEELLKGAHAMDENALQSDIKHNLPLFSALLSIWNRNFLELQTFALIPYSQALVRFTAHIQQVGMESNGKGIDRLGQLVDYQTGPIIWGEPGTNAQHSFFQLIHQGTSIIPLEFIGFKEAACEGDLVLHGTTSQEKLLSNLFAQTIALAIGQKNSNPNKVFSGNRPSHILLLKKLTPYALGLLLAYYEHKTAFEGFIWNINSFDQEGVQLGKVLANRILELFAAKRSGKKAESFPLGEALLNELEGL